MVLFYIYKNIFLKKKISFNIKKVSIYMQCTKNYLVLNEQTTCTLSIQNLDIPFVMLSVNNLQVYSKNIGNLQFKIHIKSNS